MSGVARTVSSGFVVVRLKAKIDWDTVELVGALEPVSSSVSPRPAPADRKRLFPDRRGRSSVKQILSGAAGKARARGAAYTHTQLRKLLPAGMDTLIYGWWLVAAAIEGDRDISRGVDLAAHAICVAARGVTERVS